MNELNISKLTSKYNYLANKQVEHTSPTRIYCYLENNILYISSIRNNASVDLDISTESSLSLVKIIESHFNFSEVRDLIIDKALEQVYDPRPLLAFARHASMKFSVGLSFIFADKTNKSQRTWNKESAKGLIQLSGFNIKKLTQKNSEIIINASITKKEYKRFLDSYNLPTDDFLHLMVTTEHSDYRITGGIGSYVKECEKLYGTDSAVLIIDSNIDCIAKTIDDNKWFSAQKMIGESRIEEIDASNFDMLSAIVYETIKQILFYYPNIIYIESQELLLDRTIEAKKSGIIPNYIRLITTCHGSSFHLAKAKNEMLELEQIHVAYREKRTIEDSDITIFPTKFLKNSYMKVGVKHLEDNNKIIKRLPFDITRLPIGGAVEHYTKILYIGKTSTVKGFDIFLNILQYIHQTNPILANLIEEVTVVVTSKDIYEPVVKDLFNIVSKLYNIKLISLPREELLLHLSNSSKDTLALVTYPGDNHPTVLLELLAIGHDFIALNCGGTPELIPKKYIKDYIIENDIELISKKINEIFTQNNRAQQIQAARKAYIREQIEINNLYNMKSFQTLESHKNRKKDYIFNSEVCVEIIGNSDSSNYIKSLESVKNSIYNGKIYTNKIIRNHNTLYLRLYAGDIIDPYYLQYATNYLLHFNNTAVVFTNEYVPNYENGKYIGTFEFSPVQPQLGSVFLQEKYHRRLIGLFRTITLPDNYNNLSDWELSIYICSNKYDIGIVPERLLQLYRNDNTIVWDHQFSQESMAGVLHGLSKFDAYILYAQLKWLDDIYFGAKLHNHLAEIYIHKDNTSIIHDVSPELVKFIGAYRRYAPNYIKKSAKYSIKKVHKIGKKIKSIKKQ